MGQQQEEWQGRQIHRSTQPAHIQCNLSADSSRGLLHSAWRMPSQTIMRTGVQVNSCWPHPPQLCALFARQLHFSLEPLVGGTALQGGKRGERGSSDQLAAVHSGSAANPEQCLPSWALQAIAAGPQPAKPPTAPGACGAAAPRPPGVAWTAESRLRPAPCSLPAGGSAHSTNLWQAGTEWLCLALRRAADRQDNCIVCGHDMGSLRAMCAAAHITCSLYWSTSTCCWYARTLLAAGSRRKGAPRWRLCAAASLGSCQPKSALPQARSVQQRSGTAGSST